MNPRFYARLENVREEPHFVSLRWFGKYPKEIDMFDKTYIKSRMKTSGGWPIYEAKNKS